MAETTGKLPDDLLDRWMFAARQAQRLGVPMEVEPADALLMHDAVVRRDPVRAAEQLVRLGTQVDSLTKERDACRAALDKHDAALRNRRHGGVAAGHCVYEVRKALGAPDFVDNLGPVGDIVPDGEG